MEQKEEKKEEKIFREKSIEQLSAPEQLNTYLKVTGPGVWVVMIGLIVLLIGLVVWGAIGNISSTLAAPAQVISGKAYCYVLQEDLEHSDNSVKIAIGDVAYTVVLEDSKTVTLDTSLNVGLYRSGYLSAGKTAVVLEGDVSLNDGIYQAIVTTETLKPISLLFAKN